MKNFSEELLKRGHDASIFFSLDILTDSKSKVESENLIGSQVTAITNYKRPEPHPNYTEIIINPPYNYSDCKLSKKLPRCRAEHELFDQKLQKWF